MRSLSTQVRGQREIISKALKNLVEENARAARLVKRLRKLKQTTNILEPKDLIEDQRELRAIGALNVAASNILQGIYA